MANKTDKRPLRLTKKGVVCCFFVLGFIICIQYGYEIFFGDGYLNHPSLEQYPIRGIDVSHFQGEIDWEVVSGSGAVNFAYIKATEGSSHVDDMFADNWENARNTKVAVGAYHFFSFESPGETQAENFINQVKPCDGMLPPAVDVEFYGKSLPDKEAVKRELCIVLDKLEETYGVLPVIYATNKSYRAFIQDNFDKYPLWIRNIAVRPNGKTKNWTFWQYTDKGSLEGISSGTEKYVDLNVFCGSQPDFKRFLGIDK